MSEILGKLRAYLDGHTTLYEFRSWFGPGSWRCRPGDSSHELTYQIRHRLTEFDYGYCTEDGLRANLRDVLGIAEQGLEAANRG